MAGKNKARENGTDEFDRLVTAIQGLPLVEKVEVRKPPEITSDDLILTVPVIVITCHKRPEEQYSFESEVKEIAGGLGFPEVRVELRCPRVLLTDDGQVWTGFQD